MNIIKSTFDFLGDYWTLAKDYDAYRFYSYYVKDGTFNCNLILRSKTADGLFKKIQSEINKCGFKVEKAKVIKHDRRRKDKSTNKNIGRNTCTTRSKARTKRKKSWVYFRVQRLFKRH